MSPPYQREMAQYLADAGVDLIIGHHPHVIQEIDVVNSSWTAVPHLSTTRLVIW
jgi:poly-gamma-glutamate capsule biosynthesis protein CapA/YwtB (metallophosphatase superfamily)